MEELKRLSTEEFIRSEKMPVSVVLDNVRSLNNIGSVFRTADAFRVECIYLCGITARPPHREIQKTALGATESVSWQYFPETRDAVAMLRKEGCDILAVEQTDKSVLLHDFDYAAGRKTALVFGNEVKGVEQEVIDMVDACIEIPQLGTKHSLNVSVSAGIVLWTFFRKMQWDDSMH